MKKLILASQSPYRKSLLERLFLSFESLSPNVDEDPIQNDSSLDCQTIAEKLSQLKAQAVFEAHPDAVVIGSDQVMEFENQAFGKPHTHENAISQITKMNGKSHRLLTSVTVMAPSFAETFTVATKLRLRELSQQEIENYITKDKPLDCAGSYKIESLGLTLFEKIECSDFTAIEGLPLMELSKRLRKLGFELP